MNGKVLSVQEQLQKKAKNAQTIIEILEATDYPDEWKKEANKLWVDFDDVLEILAPFLVLSPSTEEIQKLLKNRPRNFEVEGCLFTEDIDDLKKWFEGFVPKLEVFLADHVSREEVKKLKRELGERRSKTLACGDTVRLALLLDEVVERLDALYRGKAK